MPSNGDGGFSFSFDYAQNHTFTLSHDRPPPHTEHEPFHHLFSDPSKEREVVATTTVANGHSVKIADQNLNPHYTSDEDDDDFQRLKDMKKDKMTRSKTHDTTLKSKIRDDHFPGGDEEDETYDAFDPIQHRVSRHTSHHDPENVEDGLAPSMSLRRPRSKSVGSMHPLDGLMDRSSNQRTKKGSDADYVAPKTHHHKTRTEMSDPAFASPIYKRLAEMNRKLTLISFGPSRRPTHGNIHCVLKVETADGTKGQAAIPFQWDDFGNEVEGEQFAPLTHHGIPLYDKAGNEMRCRIQYKLVCPVLFKMSIRSSI